MRKPKFKKKKGPERKIQDNLVAYLRIRQWFVLETHGNVFQAGLPDLFCCHFKYKQRLIEVKNPENYKFTPAQLDCFPQMSRCGVGIWILTAATDEEYKKLFGPPNWHWYLDIMK